MKTMRLLVRNVLRQLGYENVEEAADGVHALSALKKSFEDKDPYKVFLCDWNMPEKTGIEVLKEVKADPNTKNLTFVMITAELEKHQVMEAIKLGVSNYIGKPFTPDSLKAKLTEIFEKLT